MRTATGFLFVLFTAGTLWAAGSTETWQPRSPLDDQWGPDIFGYRAKDSDEADGPDYQWIDISQTGTEVTGLADDNFVGPLNIGWDFRFYWYNVTQFWIGSNGWIKFSTSGQLAQPILSFPNALPPNDIVGCYVADWIFGAAEPGECYYWTNNEDSLIVSWNNVRAWFNGGNLGDHSFQLILSGADSSITYMYGTQTGLVSNDNLAVGIENLTGQIGISCMFGAYPPSNYAIKFTYPNPVTYTVHDLAIAGAQSPQSQGFFLLNGTSLNAWLAGRNAGNQNETDVDANYSVRQVTNNALIAGRDSTIGAIIPAQTIEIPMPALWTPITNGLYRCVGKVTLTGDIYRANDSIRTELHVISLPGELFYDDNSSNRAWGWSGGNGGMANQFEPPTYPVEVTQVRIFVVNSIFEGFNAAIYDDDGPDRTPGTMIWSEHVPDPVANGWSTVDIDPGTVVITEGMFYVAWLQELEGVTFGLDTTSAPGIARRAWESAGGVWAENRLAQEADPMIRCTIASASPPNNPPGAFSRVTPGDSLLEIGPIVCSWTRSVDPDTDQVRYIFHIESPTFPDELIIPTDSVTSDTSIEVEIMIPVSPLDEIHNFFWTVHATDGEDTVAPTNGEGHFQLDIAEAVNGGSAVVISDYSLAAYPNPFNNSVQIRYELPDRAKFELAIFNLNGERVATLVAGSRGPGSYAAQWNAARFASGMYFVSLSTERVSRLEKILLIK